MAPSTLWDAVGNTPLLRIGTLSERTGNEVLGKAEFMNPGGSIKDRAAKGMIHAAETAGLLRPGGTIVEGTAGNTGIGLAVLGRERGYRVVVTMPDNQAREKYELLEALGATVVKVPVVPFANEHHFFHQARRLAEQNGWWWANQFENTANADMHAATTAEEIWAQCEGRVDVLVAACGTGGTLGGVSSALKAKNPRLQVVLVDPPGSGLYAWVKQGKLEASGGSITEGIGIMRLTENFKRARIDDALRIDDSQSLTMLMHLAREDGLFVGTSSAINVAAAYAVAQARPKQGLRIVTFLCDHGSRYASKVLDPAFLASKGITVSALA